MEDRRYGSIKACVFAAYGTLFDLDSAVQPHRERMGDVADRVSALWRTKQLEYTWWRSLMQQYENFWQVTKEALAFAFEAVGLKDEDLHRDLMEEYLHLECYPDVKETLEVLKARGLLTAILSSGSPSMLHKAVSHAGLCELFDHILSVEEAGIYKPHARVYRLAVQRLDVKAKEICFVSANAWDVAGAAGFGLRTVWINRSAQLPEVLPGRAEAELEALSALPALLDS